MNIEIVWNLTEPFSPTLPPPKNYISKFCTQLYLHHSKRPSSDQIFRSQYLINYSSNPYQKPKVIKTNFKINHNKKLVTNFATHRRIIIIISKALLETWPSARNKNHSFWFGLLKAHVTESASDIICIYNYSAVCCKICRFQ